MAVSLPYTLQTHLGMVMNNGGPKERMIPTTIPNIRLKEDGKAKGHLRFHLDPVSRELPDLHFHKDRHRYQASEIVTDKAAKIISDRDIYKNCSSKIYPDRRMRQFAANLDACSRTVTNQDLQSWIQSRIRFDLEQAAAIVVSAFRSEGRIKDAARLVKELGTVLSTSCMWVEPNVLLPKSQGARVHPGKVARMLQQSAALRNQTIPLASSYTELLPLLMRVRRSKPDDRCLHLPEWLFKETTTTAPEHFKSFFTVEGLSPQAPSPGCQPIAPCGSDSIILSRKHFRSIQRRIFRLYQYWKPNIVFRKAIKNLEENVLYASSWIESRVFATNDVALIAHYFFHFQRRLQRKVVSDNWWSGFLDKGESGTVYQNNMNKKSTFENVLLKIAESNDLGVIVAMGNDDTIPLIDKTCLLMHEYVQIYGGGKTSNLAFKIGVRGGSGRGPVDDYNLLCDILSDLRKRAREEGIKDVPGPVHKFLAKDIMSWNGHFEDDAFADNKRAGWQDWVEKRGLLKQDDDDDWETVELREGVDNEKSFPALVML
jgi:hypothetical protein